MKKYLLFFLLLATEKEVSSQILTLEKAINTALANSLDIQLARNNQEAAQLNYEVAKSSALPRVTASLTDNQSITNLNQTLNNGVNIKRPNNANNIINSGVSANMVVFNGYLIKTTQKRMQVLSRQNENVIKAQIQNIASGVAAKYFEIVRQKSYLNTIQQSIFVSEKTKELIEIRKSVGLANNADLFQAQLDLNAAYQELKAQQLVLSQSKTDLMAMLNQRPDSVYNVEDTIMVDTTLALENIITAIKKNPELLIAMDQIKVNEYLVQEAGTGRYPVASVSGGYNYSRSQSTAGNLLLNQNHGPFVGFNVAIPIYNGGIIKKQQAIATTAMRNASISSDILSNNLIAAATKSWQAYLNYLQRISAEKENNKIADSLLKLTFIRYQYKVATILEVKEAQRSYVEAGYRMVNLLYGAKVAEIELKRLAGIYPSD